jgi:hypothetical protein
LKGEGQKIIGGYLGQLKGRELVHEEDPLIGIITHSSIEEIRVVDHRQLKTGSHHHRGETTEETVDQGAETILNQNLSIIEEMRKEGEATKNQLINRSQCNSKLLLKRPIINLKSEEEGGAGEEREGMEARRMS